MFYLTLFFLIDERIVKTHFEKKILSIYESGEEIQMKQSYSYEVPYQKQLLLPF